MALFGSPGRKLLSALNDPASDWKRLLSLADGLSIAKEKPGTDVAILGSIVEKACDSDSLPLDDFGSLLRRLSSSGMDLNAPIGTRGETALHLAVSHGNERVVEALSLAGSSPAAACGGGMTPLHSAVSGGNLRMVELLLRLGADVNAEDSEGNTPLHLAVGLSEMDALVAALLDAGAVGWARNRKGETPAGIAAFTGNREYCTHIEKALSIQRTSRLLQWKCPVCASPMPRPAPPRVEWLVALGVWEHLSFTCGRCGRRTEAPELDGER
ncbi:MAG: ankyrin repeat domain-containing protein [Candidatus Fermentibacter sp.]|nr:ankyrin repeat domain-containing protein [Candidatus Fermentibacter sp.]